MHVNTFYFNLIILHFKQALMKILEISDMLRIENKEYEEALSEHIAGIDLSARKQMNFEYDIIYGFPTTGKSTFQQSLIDDGKNFTVDTDDIIFGLAYSMGFGDELKSMRTPPWMDHDEPIGKVWRLYSYMTNLFIERLMSNPMYKGKITLLTNNSVFVKHFKDSFRSVGFFRSSPDEVVDLFNARRDEKRRDQMLDEQATQLKDWARTAIPADSNVDWLNEVVILEEGQFISDHLKDPANGTLPPIPVDKKSDGTLSEFSTDEEIISFTENNLSQHLVANMLSSTNVNK